ncbi:TatD family hydrolase [Proteiniphilum sp. UBA5431]|uniref:TatD family hydrolase n=1 Tax=Proteiniphilum sp. UBA5431 TaxID=1947280 RepID=UPI00257A692E|nr:TatD family hydrolase [Proteiniphilum sp. UBA5431]
MSLIDTHAHLFAEEFEHDIAEVISRAKEMGVRKVLLPNIDETSIDSLKRTTEHYPGFFYPMIGLHPTSVTRDWKKQLYAIYQEYSNGSYIAAGEIGIDLYWDTTFRKEQIEAFEEQLKWCTEKNVPASIHFRNATEEVIKSIKRVGAKSLRGVFHSFGGNLDELEEIMKLKNFWVGINGVVTFKNSGLSETLKLCPIDKILLETDSPYLAPVPYRGKRNEPSYLPCIVKKLSEVWKETEENIIEVTSSSAKELFNITV